MRNKIIPFSQPNIEKSKTPQQKFQPQLGYNQSLRSFDTNQPYNKIPKKAILPMITRKVILKKTMPLINRGIYQLWP